MTINAAALTLIKNAEGFVDHWYPDPGTGGAPWTCCYGHTETAGPPVYDAHAVFTEAQGEAILLADLAGVEAILTRHVTVPLTANQKGAIVSFVFNVGEANFASSTLLKKLNAGNYAGAAAELPRWDHAAGKVLPGLTKRRAAEQALFLAPAAAVVPPAQQSTTPAPSNSGPSSPQTPPPVTAPKQSFWAMLIEALLSFLNRKV